jgi:hypothetical protein
VAVPKDLAERSAPLLPPGSQVRQAFICQTAPNFAFFLINWATGLTMFWITYRCVAVTRDAIYVLDSPKLSGRWGQMTLLGTRHWVKKRFQSEIAAADAEEGFAN